MEKTKSKLIKLFAFCALVALPCLALFAACGGNTENKIMNVSTNPSVEFVLDANNKVISASANNDEGNFVIANVSFEGLTAEQATNAFIEFSKEQGYLIEGSITAGQNEVNVSISGDDAQQLFDKIQASVEQKLTDLDIEATLQKGAEITKDNLEALVKECMQEYDASKLDTMSEQELINLIKQSREETKTFMTEELKDFYYQVRFEELKKAELQAKIDIIEAGSATGSLIVIPLEIALEDIDTAITSFKEKFEAEFLSAESAYNQKMEEFITAKKAYLADRADAVKQQALETAEQVLASAKTAAELALATVNAGLTSAFNAFEAALDTIIEAQSSISSLLNNSVNNIQQSVDTAKTSILNGFKNDTNISVYVGADNSYWKIEIAQ